MRLGTSNSYRHCLLCCGTAQQIARRGKQPQPASPLNLKWLLVQRVGRGQAHLAASASLVHLLSTVPGSRASTSPVSALSLFCVLVTRSSTFCEPR